MKSIFAQEPNTRSAFLGALYASLLSVVVCMVLLAGASWAWFTVSQSSGVQTITAANYSVTAEVRTLTGDSVAEMSVGDVVSVGENGVYTLSNGNYAITLTAGGNATHGHAVLTLDDDNVFETVQLERNTSPTIYFSINKIGVAEETAQTTLKVSACWCDNSANNPAINFNGTGYTYTGDTKITAGLTSIEEPECDCIIKCSDGGNTDCPVCAEKADACKGSVCSCTVKCGEDAANTECPVCKEHAEHCSGAEATCACDSRCNAEEPNAECPVCQQTLDKCVGVAGETTPDDPNAGEDGENPNNSTGGEAGDEPAADQPAADQPTGDQPTADQPVGDQPAADQSAGDQPAADQPTGDQSAGDQPTGDQPTGDLPAADQPTGDQPAGDQPAGDQTAGDQSAGDQSAGDQSAGDQSAGDQSTGDQTADDQSTGGQTATDPAE